MIIREENINEYEEIKQLVKIAFESAEQSDGNEHELVSALRLGDGYIKELSLVAVIDEKMVGHVMFTKAYVEDTKVLALAPVSVLPEYQKQGIGSALIEAGHQKAKDFGYEYSVVLGSHDYYPKFGYVPADTFNIYAPFEVPREYFMAVKLTEGAREVNGRLKYAKEFGI